MLRTTLDDKWIPDTKRLEGMLNTTTKMIVLNYPNNPTGKVLDKRTTEKIVSIAKDHGLYLSDEVYADYVFGEFNSTQLRLLQDDYSGFFFKALCNDWI